jgi:hypothetical protein
MALELILRLSHLGAFETGFGLIGIGLGLLFGLSCLLN